MSVPERELLVAQCMKFEKNLQMLEAYLIYNMWLSAEQVRYVCQAFQERGAPEAVLVRCVCMLFSRTIDLENLFPALTQYLGGDFVWELTHRLGILNLLSPVHPDGPYELDLAAFDDREACTVLVRLAVIESLGRAGGGALSAADAAAAVPRVFFHNPDYRRSAAEPWANEGRGAGKKKNGEGNANAADSSSKGWQVPIAWRDNDPAGPPKFGAFRCIFQSSTDEEAVSDEGGDKDGTRERDEAEDADEEGDGTSAAAAAANQPVYEINPAARAELMAYRCLAGSKGTFIKGAPASSTDIRHHGAPVDTSETDALIHEADWTYVFSSSSASNSEDRAHNHHHPSASPYLDVVGYKASYFGPEYKMPAVTEKFIL